jgi:hypothetical protein
VRFDGLRPGVEYPVWWEQCATDNATGNVVCGIPEAPLTEEGDEGADIAYFRMVTGPTQEVVIPVSRTFTNHYLVMAEPGAVEELGPGYATEIDCQDPAFACSIRISVEGLLFDPIPLPFAAQ